jgi:hypothetical protein
MRPFNPRWTILIVLNVLFGCVLCFNQQGYTQPKAAAEPFANATGQRAEMIALLKELNAQLKEQNALLASGKLQVVAVPGKEKPGG